MAVVGGFFVRRVQLPGCREVWTLGRKEERRIRQCLELKITSDTVILPVHLMGQVLMPAPGSSFRPVISAGQTFGDFVCVVCSLDASNA